MALTAQQVKDEILNWFNDNEEDYNEDDFDYEVWNEFMETLNTKESIEKYPTWGTPVLSSGPAFKVEEESGEDGFIVFSIGDQLFRVLGSYNSWDGGEYYYDELHEVEPYEVTVTRYKRK